MANKYYYTLTIIIIINFVGIVVVYDNGNVVVII